TVVGRTHLRGCHHPVGPGQGRYSRRSGAAAVAAAGAAVGRQGRGETNRVVVAGLAGVRRAGGARRQPRSRQVVDGGGPGPPRDLDLVAKAVREYQPALLVIDPLFAVMGLDRRGRFIKASDDQSVRQLTGELKQLAEETAMTVLLIRHLNKNRRGSAVLRGS